MSVEVTQPHNIISFSLFEFSRLNTKKKILKCIELYYFSGFFRNFSDFYIFSDFFPFRFPPIFPRNFRDFPGFFFFFFFRFFNLIFSPNITRIFTTDFFIYLFFFFEFFSTFAMLQNETFFKVIVKF